MAYIITLCYAMALHSGGWLLVVLRRDVMNLFFSRRRHLTLLNVAIS